jgi:nucleoside-diphosphate-sugar epimerase
MALGTSRLRIVVLRLAECVAADNGSQLYDQIRSTVCVRPAGFDPMLDLLSLDDAAEAFRLAVRYDGRGIFNIAGFDTLPLSEAFARSGRRTVAVPGPLLHPLYGLRALLRGTDFRYDANRWRFHFNGVLDGRHARAQIGYVPKHPLPWLSTDVDRDRRAANAIGAI